MSPYKDPKKDKIKTRKITILEERWNMFDQAKKIAEKELGVMGNGTFMELLITNFLIENQYQNELRFNKKSNSKRKSS